MVLLELLTFALHLRACVSTIYTASKQTSLECGSLVPLWYSEPHKLLSPQIESSERRGKLTRRRSLFRESHCTKAVTGYRTARRSLIATSSLRDRKFDIVPALG